MNYYKKKYYQKTILIFKLKNNKI